MVCTVALIRECFFWNTMYQDVSNCIKTCKRFERAKGPYNDPNFKWGSVVVNSPLGLPCLDFTTMDSSRNRNQNVLIMMDALSNFTVVVVTPHQQAKKVTESLVDRWFYTFKIPSRLHSDLSSFVSTYNDMPNATTGLQPYQLMFGCEARMPCDN